MRRHPVGWVDLVIIPWLLAAVAGEAATLQPFLSGLSSPIFITNAKDGSNRLFIVEQGGVIKVVQPGSTTPTVFLNIPVLSGGERGLLGLTFHPQYASNRRFFVDYTRQGDGATVIAEYHASLADPNVADAGEIIHLTVAQPFSNHKGGMIEFGPDDFLYIAMGDGGSGNDPGNRAQNINELLGKILRIDVDTPNGQVPYSSPPTNPFFDATPGADEIYAFGFRNPWRFSFDRTNGTLWVGDVGQGAWEEIDTVTLGGNYGWRVFEGNHCTNLDPPLCSGTYTAPVLEYGHSGGRCSVTGGYAYRGVAGALAQGQYVYADYCTGEIFSSGALLLDTSFNIPSFGEDEVGELYVVSLGGAISKFVPDPAVPTSTPTRTRTPTGTETPVGFTPTRTPTPTNTPAPTLTHTATPVSAVCTSFATGVCCDSAAGINCKAPVVICTSNAACAGQTPFNVCAGAGTDNAQAASTTPGTYGGFAFQQCFAGTASIGVSRSFSGGTFAVNDGLLQWDTSTLPDTALVTSAALTVSVTGRSDSDARNFQGEWFNWGATCDASDWADTVAATAFSVPNSSLTPSTAPTIALMGAAANVNVTGRTFLRLNISGGQPTGPNRVIFAAFNNSTAPGPRLTVCYTP